MVLQARLRGQWDNDGATRLIGTLDGGYFVTREETGAPYSLDLRHAYEPTVILDSVTTPAGAGADGQEDWAQNDAGDVYYAEYGGSGTTRSLVHVTQAGGAISATSVGTFTVAAAANVVKLFVDHAGSTVAWRKSDAGAPCEILNAADATLRYAVTYTGHAVVPLVNAGSDQLLVYCNTDDAWELWDGTTSTLLDSEADSGSWSPGQWCVSGTDRAFMAAGVYSSGASVKPVAIGALSTAGGTLSWAWGPTTFTPAWDSTDTFVEMACAAWADVAAVVPASATFTDPPPLYTVDVSTGEYRASTPNVVVTYGVYDRGQDQYSIGWCGPASFTFGPDIGGIGYNWSVWDYGAQSFLRQRQSPRATPSRVRGPNLRQRQTPFIR